MNIRLIFIFTSLLILSTFTVFAQNTTNCNMPTCEGAYTNGKTDSSGCAIYVCPQSQYCKDSDAGLSFFVRGQTTLINTNPNSTSTGFDDQCLSSKTLSEGYCENDQIMTQKFDCKYGCSDGVCIQEMSSNSTDSAKIEYSCGDSDGGLNYYISGITQSVICPGGDNSCLAADGVDECLENGKDLREYYCSNSKINNKVYSCEHGCANGACIDKMPKATEKVTCLFKGSETSQECYAGEIQTGCKGIGTCSTSVSEKKGKEITWKSSCGGYQYTLSDGDDETVTFSCEEKVESTEQLKETWFKGAYWQCHDGTESKEGGESSCKPSELWQKYALEACNDHCTKDGSKCGVNAFSVFNVCYPDPNSNEESIPASTSGSSDIQKTSCDNYIKDCKSGYESACSKWKENCNSDSAEKTGFKEEVLICKDACPSDGKCYPFGYRKADNFCSDSGKFISQITGEEKCENNFQCASNVCISNQCVSQGFIDKFVNWFKNLFGGE
ncbi:MAG: hypothetical protein AABX35_03785 [Nanoarchaeota archaeon]